MLKDDSITGFLITPTRTFKTYYLLFVTLIHVPVEVTGMWRKRCINELLWSFEAYLGG